MHLLAKDADMSLNDPLLLEMLGRFREEEPEKWEALVGMLTPGAKA